LRLVSSIIDVGILYESLGRLNEAERPFQRALQGYEKALGPDHTSTLRTAHNLGLLPTHGQTPLSWPTEYGYEAVVKLFVD
jgi:hypothetical protein